MIPLLIYKTFNKKVNHYQTKKKSSTTNRNYIINHKTKQLISTTGPTKYTNTDQQAINQMPQKHIPTTIPIKLDNCPINYSSSNSRLHPHPPFSSKKTEKYQLQ